MFGVIDITTYLIGVVIIVLLPGPNSLFVLSVAAKRGVHMGYRAAWGVCLGDLVLMVLAAAGMASLLQTYPSLFMVMKYAGAVYLTYVGISLLHAAWQRARTTTSQADVLDAAPSQDMHAQDMRDPFRRALAIGLMNPKSIFFFMSFFIQFVDRSYAYPALSFVVLGVIVQVLNFIYLSALIFGGVRLAQMVGRKPLLASGASAGAGTLFLGFSAKLASSAAN